jgi:hypothetical protein
MTQNFNPAKLVLDVENLLKEVSDLKNLISGDPDFSVRDIAEALDAAARVCGDLVPRVAEIESQIAPFIPLLEPLRELFAGKIAGTGATEAEGIRISQEEFAASDLTQTKEA